MQVDFDKLKAAGSPGDIKTLRAAYESQLKANGVDEKSLSFATFRELVALDWWSTVASLATKYGPMLLSAVATAYEYFKKYNSTGGKDEFLDIVKEDLDILRNKHSE